MRAAPLTCFRKTGELYTRHQAVEDEITRALGMSHATNHGGSRLWFISSAFGGVTMIRMF